MTTDLIRYDLLVQDALRSVVRKVLTDTARDGVPGEHHYYVSFRTAAPGVRISNRLREKYPEEMTIVLQHQFWDLGVTDHTFEVGLAFGGIPERLLVPFDAVSGFFDPSVQFGLKFEVDGLAGDDVEPKGKSAKNDEAQITGKSKLGSIAKTALPAPATAPALPATAKANADPIAGKIEKSRPKPKLETGNDDKRDGVTGKQTQKPPADEKPGDANAEKPTVREGAEVVSLDAFRKKN